MTTDGFLAVRNGNLPLLKHLIAEKKTSLTHTRWSGMTLLHRAADVAQVEIIKYLMEIGANPAAKTFRGGDTPLHLAVSAGHEKAAMALLEGGAPWVPSKQKPKMAVNNRGETPMRTAVRKGYQLMAQRLELQYYILDGQRQKAKAAEARAEARRSREPTPNPTPRPPPINEERSEATGPPWVAAEPSLPEAAPPAPAGIS